MTSSPEHWPELASLVDALLDAPPDRRAALLDHMSGGDAVRRAKLERIRGDCERDPPLLSRPAAEQFAGLFDDISAGFPPSLAARYRLTKELGRGGMATVYLAHDVKHRREVAVKVVHPALASVLGPERFLREIEIAAQLHHPHIMPLFDSGESDGSLYYVMPYEPGLSLRQRLERDGPLPLDQAIQLLRDVCEALSYAHERGIIHRDIKPDNVLLAGRHAVVTDFGVAKALTPSGDRTLTGAGLALGTPAYMAPEQIDADPALDHRADIYAIGVLAYEMLTGRPPFTGDTGHGVLSAHLTAAPVPIGAHRPDLPAPMTELVMKALAKRPADRWQSTAEMVEVLEARGGAREGTEGPRTAARLRRWAAAALVIAVLAVVVTVLRRPAASAGRVLGDAWSNARFERLTDFAGSELDAAISADGRFVAFLADRDSVFDGFVSQIGSGRFVNLTGGRVSQLYNEDVRNIGFSADASHVWIRVADIAAPATVSLVPTMGGPPKPFLGTAVMATWSPDGARLAYHETTPGDPIFVAAGDGANPSRLAIAVPGVHQHHLTWSPDGRYLYFARGLPPDEMDIWRIPVAGGPSEQITSHQSRESNPALLDDRTLLYTATADDGTGPWLYAMDLEDRMAQRVSPGVEHYLSIDATAPMPGQPRRLVATVSNPVVQLWSVPIGDQIADETVATRVTLPTARAAAPRFGPDSTLFYLASRSGADGVWRLAGDVGSEIWKPGEGGVVGAVAISPDGSQVCFPVRRASRSTLFCTSAEGTGVRAVAESLDVRGAATWSPDGKWIAVGAMDGTGTRVFKVPVDGGVPVRLVDSVSYNPVWSPDGRFILYSGAPRARTVVLRAVTPDGRPFPVPTLTVDRLGDSYRFLPDGRGLVVKLGGFRLQDFWLVDLASGARRQLTRLKPGESLHRFDVSPDGRRVLFERVRENSDVVLIEMPGR
jgi:Tol biopolymer transport system component/tRNA A-37 threonylcarbamoyl transferase component Bud32